MSPRQKLVIVLLILSNLVVFPLVAFLLLSGPAEAHDSNSGPTSQPEATPAPALALVATPSPAFSPTPPAASSVEDTPPGWTRYKTADQTISLALPPSWQPLTIDRARLEANLARLKSTDPKLAADLLEQSRGVLGDGFMFFAFDNAATSAHPDFMTNVNLVSAPAAFPLTLDAYAAFSYRQLTALTTIIGPISQRRVRLEGGEAEEFAFKQDLDVDGKPIRTSTLQYVMVRDRRTDVLTLTSLDSEAANYAGTFAAIASSLDWSAP